MLWPFIKVFIHSTVCNLIVRKKNSNVLLLKFICERINCIERYSNGFNFHHFQDVLSTIKDNEKITYTWLTRFFFHKTRRFTHILALWCTIKKSFGIFYYNRIFNDKMYQMILNCNVEACERRNTTTTKWETNGCNVTEAQFHHNQSISMKRLYYLKCYTIMKWFFLYYTWSKIKITHFLFKYMYRYRRVCVCVGLYH